MPRRTNKTAPATAPSPLTEPLTIELTLRGRDLEHFNAYREAVYALNPDNWSQELKDAFTGVKSQREEYRPKKEAAGMALAQILCEQVDAQLSSPADG
jgi:hypothetical protein